MQLKDLNLIPKNYYVKKKEKAKKAYLSVLIIIAAAALSAAYITSVLLERELESDKSVLQKKVEETYSYVVYQNDFSKLKQAVEVREKEAEALSGKRLNLTGIVAAVEKASPEKLFVKKFDSNGEDDSDVKVTLTGIAENEDTIASFIRNLKEEAYFKEYSLSAITNKDGSNGSSFNIVLTGVNKDKLTKYNGVGHDFSIGYIPGWSISVEKDNNVIFTDKTISQIAAKPATVEILSEPIKQNAEAYASDRKVKLEKELKSFKQGYSFKTENSGADAVKTVYSAIEDNVEYRCSELCTVKNGKGYIVTYKCDSASFKNTEQIIDRVLRSFSIN
jgi:Tfp pilus assembly protein PilN